MGSRAIRSLLHRIARFISSSLNFVAAILTCVASEQCLGMFERISKEFLQRCVTVDETWIHY